MNIPTIEELIALGAAASDDLDFEAAQTAATTAIRDAVVAACKPQLRPIEEMPEDVPEGCIRKFAKAGEWLFSSRCYKGLDTHFIDIALPVEAYPADFELAFAESKLDDNDKDAAFRLWKGGVR